MNVVFQSVASAKSFREALVSAPCIGQWLIQKMKGDYGDEMPVIEIGIDPWQRKDEDKPDDYVWGIYSYEVDDYGERIGDNKYHLNGGLIYRGLNDEGQIFYSSHT